MVTGLSHGTHQGRSLAFPTNQLKSAVNVLDCNFLTLHGCLQSLAGKAKIYCCVLILSITSTQH